jgi:hypothetical protein
MGIEDALLGAIVCKKDLGSISISPQRRDPYSQAYSRVGKPFISIRAKGASSSLPDLLKMLT